MNPDPVLTLLLYGVLPLWMLAGVADWWCHRKSDIEHTAGVGESLLHLLMFAQMGAAVLICLFLDINALAFAILLLLFATHEATALWDVSYASKRRRISPAEQHVHSFLELLPLMALALLAVKYWPVLQAWASEGQADWTLRFKDEPVPTHYIVVILATATLFELLPFGQELYRTWQARRLLKVRTHGRGRGA